MKPSFIDGENWLLIQEFNDEGQVEGILHFVSTDDIIEHDPSMNCECSPFFLERDPDTGEEIIAHHRLKDWKQ